VEEGPSSFIQIDGKGGRSLRYSPHVDFLHIGAGSGKEERRGKEENDGFELVWAYRPWQSPFPLVSKISDRAAVAIGERKRELSAEREEKRRRKRGEQGRKRLLLKIWGRRNSHQRSERDLFVRDSAIPYEQIDWDS